MTILLAGSACVYSVSLYSAATAAKTNGTTVQSLPIKHQSPHHSFIIEHQRIIKKLLRRLAQLSEHHRSIHDIMITEHTACTNPEAQAAIAHIIRNHAAHLATIAAQTEGLMYSYIDYETFLAKSLPTIHFPIIVHPPQSNSLHPCASTSTVHSPAQKTAGAIVPAPAHFPSTHSNGHTPHNHSHGHLPLLGLPSTQIQKFITQTNGWTKTNKS